MTTKQLLIDAASVLKHVNIQQPLLDAQVLLMFCWKKNQIQLILASDEVPPTKVSQAFFSLIKRRQAGEPVAYLCGEKEFYSRMFRVNQDVLIPRPETEHLIEAVQHFFPDNHADFSLCDVGTGSGCIAVTLACEYANAHVCATDISPNSLVIAQQNAEDHHVEDRMQFFQGNMLQVFEPQSQFDLIISNPPYVTLKEYQQLAPELYFEPRHALTDEQDGLLFLQMLLMSAPKYLKRGGKLILETGLCGLPAVPVGMRFLQDILDLAGHLRGGVYEKE